MKGISRSCKGSVTGNMPVQATDNLLRNLCPSFAFLTAQLYKTEVNSGVSFVRLPC